ncbi:MAG: Na/Pi cotransporter family protein [Gemmatimonadaceae bacterium]|nr:Na/Pi cotransporter family protein [Gemmatimonadaceae bacterium]MCW5827111.1 Na/Pi cotransporter family protein [Gemmatimonadaceae bacterium]
MSGFQIFIGVTAAVILFLHGLQSFSHELQAVAGPVMRRWLARVTASRIRGMAVGALATGIVQSSSAISAITVALVDAGTLTFRASLGVMLGANIGTTTTAWLVSYKLTGIGPVFIVIGALLGFLPTKARVAGKAVFYFGFIFFALDLISAALQPLQTNGVWQAWLSAADDPWSGVAVGILATALLQSSSVVVGLAILLVQQGLLPPEAAVPIVIGSNVGTTSTALVASLHLGPVARRSASANLMFNLGGLVLVAPVLPWFARTVTRLSDTPAIAVASAHLYFNVGIAVVFLVVLSLMHKRLERFDQPPRPSEGPV